MADTLTLEIVTPDGLKLSEPVSEFTAPSVDGEFGVLPGHRPMLAALSTGIVTYVVQGQNHSVAVGAGFAEVVDDRAAILTDRFCRKADIDPVLVRKELKEVDEALDHFEGDRSGAEYAELVARELWLAAQLDLYGDPPPPRLRTQVDAPAGAQENYAALAADTNESEKTDGAAS